MVEHSPRVSASRLPLLSTHVQYQSRVKVERSSYFITFWPGGQALLHNERRFAERSALAMKRGMQRLYLATNVSSVVESGYAAVFLLH
jgi:hypothetical protein